MPIADSTEPGEFDVAPAFLTDAQAAQFLGLHPHQLYLFRCGKKPGGPPFVMHGARVRYPVAGLRKWAASLPQFITRAEAYAANPVRAKGAARQRATTAKARKAKIEKSRGRKQSRGHPSSPPMLQTMQRRAAGGVSLQTAQGFVFGQKTRRSDCQDANHRKADMTCEAEPTDHPDQGQGWAGSGPGGPLGDRRFRQRKAVWSLAALEGDPIEPDEPDPQGRRGHAGVVRQPPPRVR